MRASITTSAWDLKPKSGVSHGRRKMSGSHVTLPSASKRATDRVPADSSFLFPARSSGL
jgi:hypothetical protein